MSSTPALQAAILRQISTSPEVVETLKNLQKITQINLESPQFKSELKHFSEQHMTLYKSHTTQEGTVHYVCFLQDQRQGDFYIHQLTGELFRVQPLEGLVLQRKQSDQAKLDQVNLVHLQKIYEKLNAYLERHFAGAYAATCHLRTDAGTITEVIIGITNKKISPNNFSSAQWTSYWSFKSAQYSAKIVSKNHFHEGGNIIFQRPKSIHRVLVAQKQLTLSSLTQHTIDQIVSAIQNEQRLYQKQIQNIIGQKLSQSLKKLRRISPLTQGKMIWNINAVVLSQGLSEKLSNLM